MGFLLSSRFFPFVRRLFAVMVCALLLSQTITASSQTPRRAVPAASTPQPLQGFNLNFGFCKEIALTAVAVGAVVGVGLYLLLRKGPGITGCTVENAGGRQIRDEADQRTYTLSGRTAPLRSDERVRVFGKKQKRSSTDSNFVVKKSSKPIGACTVAPIH